MGKSINNYEWMDDATRKAFDDYDDWVNYSTKRIKSTVATLKELQKDGIDIGCFNFKKRFTAYVYEYVDPIYGMCQNRDEDVYFILDAVDENDVEEMMGYWRSWSGDEHAVDGEIEFVRNYINSKG